MSNFNFSKLIKNKNFILYTSTFFLILIIVFSLTFKNSNLVFAQTTPTTSFGLQVDSNAPFTASGGTFNLLLVARSDTEGANLFSAKITFPANELIVKSIDATTGSFIPEGLQVDHSFNNTTGTISIVGGYSGGYKTNSTDNPSTMATITFQRTGPDPVTFHFTPSTSGNVNQTAIFSNTSNHNILVSSPDLTLDDSNIPTPTPTQTPCQSNCGGDSPPPPSTGNGGSAPSAVLGDIDNNGKVDVFDLSKLLIDWNTGTAEADLDHNGSVDVFDLSILLINWTY